MEREKFGVLCGAVEPESWSRSPVGRGQKGHKAGNSFCWADKHHQMGWKGSCTSAESCFNCQP